MYSHPRVVIASVDDEDAPKELDFAPHPQGRLCNAVDDGALEEAPMRHAVIVCRGIEHLDTRIAGVKTQEDAAEAPRFILTLCHSLAKAREESENRGLERANAVIKPVASSPRKNCRIREVLQ